MTNPKPQHPSPEDEKRAARIAYHKHYRKNNADKIAQKAKEKYQKNRKEILAKKKKHRLENLETYKERGAKFYQKNKERLLKEAATRREGKREELAAWQREYRAKNPEKMKARDREQYQKHRERNLAQKSAWGKTEDGKIKQRAKNQKRRAIKKSVKSTLTADQLRDIVKKSGGACFYCGQKGKLSIDHIIPISKGGPHSRDNIVMACIPCNSSKGAKDPAVFAKERGILII